MKLRKIPLDFKRLLSKKPPTPILTIICQKLGIENVRTPCLFEINMNIHPGILLDLRKSPQFSMICLQLVLVSM